MNEANIDYIYEVKQGIYEYFMERCESNHVRRYNCPHCCKIFVEELAKDLKNHYKDW